MTELFEAIRKAARAYLDRNHGLPTRGGFTLEETRELVERSHRVGMRHAVDLVTTFSGTRANEINHDAARELARAIARFDWLKGGESCLQSDGTKIHEFKWERSCSGCGLTVNEILKTIATENHVIRHAVIVGDV